MPTPPDPEHPNQTLVLNLCRGCTVWKGGIYWETDEGTQAMVQVTEENHCISLLVSLNQECPADSLDLCSSMIDLIRSKQKELCSSIEVYEYLISPSELSHVPHRNFSQLTVFAIEDVAKSVWDKKWFVFDSKRKERISLECLQHFDPQQVLPPTAVQQLFASDKSSEPVPASFFAGRNPLVSGFSDRCVWSSQWTVTPLTIALLLSWFMCCFFLPSCPLCVQELAEMTAADLPHLPQGTLPTSATPTPPVPLVSGFSDRDVWSSQWTVIPLTMASSFMFYSFFLPFPCVCRSCLRWLLQTYLIFHKVLYPPVPHPCHLFP